MTGKRDSASRGWLLSAVAFGALMAGNANAADVSTERLINVDKEPQNWLMVHRDYSATRYSPLDQINKQTIKNLKVAFTVAIGGMEPGGDLKSSRGQATPLVEDGFMYIIDGWGVVYKIDMRSGTKARIVWKADPGVDKSTVWIPSDRGVALYKDKVVATTTDGRLLVINKDTGRILIDQNMKTQRPDGFTAAPLVVKDKIIVGSTGGDIGGSGWLAAYDPETKKTAWTWNVIPRPGEPGHETWKDKNEAWKTGGGALWYTGAYDPETNRLYWGTGQPVPMFDPEFRPGDNLYTNSTVAIDADTGKLVWYFQYTPNDQWDYDEVGSQMLINVSAGGQSRKALAHFGRNGIFYTLDRANGSFIQGGQYVKTLNWTKGIDPKTGKPLEYDPAKDVQDYASAATHRRGSPAVGVCPTQHGGSSYQPTAVSLRANMAYQSGLEGCIEIKSDAGKLGGGANPNATQSWNGGLQNNTTPVGGSLTAIDLATGKVKAQVVDEAPSYTGALATAGGLVFAGWANGDFKAYDDSTLEPLFTFSTGDLLGAPPMTFMINGKQYVAILAGSGQTPTTGDMKSDKDLWLMHSSAVIYVFSL